MSETPVDHLGAIVPRWDDNSLAVPSDTRWRAPYRWLQSWYREVVLRVPPGRDGRAVVRGNLLPEEEVRHRPGLNFLNEGIATYVRRRIPEIQREGGTVGVDRVYRNMLSSMPLCFNIFGEFRAHRGAAAAVLRAVFGIDIATIEEVHVEWAPDPKLHLQDRTAFDSFVRYRTSSGGSAFLGIETKYTEPFSPKRHDTPILQAFTADPDSGFKPGAAAVLRQSATNQLWRNSLLAFSLRRKEGYADGHVVVLACKADPAVERAVRVWSSQHTKPQSLLRSATYEQLVRAAAAQPDFASWADEFRRRYLDLPPVLASD